MGVTFNANRAFNVHSIPFCNQAEQYFNNSIPEPLTYITLTTQG